MTSHAHKTKQLCDGVIVAVDYIGLFMCYVLIRLFYMFASRMFCVYV